MNFLLHRHLGARDLGSTTAGIGAMLPDLWRMADRRVRPSAVDATPAARPALDDLLMGVQHHVAADRWFHCHAVFRDGEQDASRRLRDARIGARRTVLFAHVLWELCLDGEIVRRQGLGSVMAAVRDGLRLSQGVLSQAAEAHHFSRIARSPEERRVFESELVRITRALESGPWIEGYQTAVGIAARIQGVRARVGLEPMTEDDEARVADVAGALQGRAVDAVDSILARPSFAEPFTAPAHECLG